jgi:quinol monooxygenase YgiN
MEVRMSARWLLTLGAMTLTACFTSLHRRAAAPAQRLVVRLAELQIDPAQLAQYLAFLREEVETSIRVEPGVLTLYAVQLKSDPTQVRMFEMYADSSAYNAHIASAHFRKYKVGTQPMVKSLVLNEADPVALRTKGSDVLASYGVDSNQ